MVATPAVHTLYHNPFSICSLMVRYTVALRGPARDKASEIPIQDQSVDIFHEEQLSEHFLRNINPKGQVPVLTSPTLGAPIADSMDITRYLAKYYPAIIPASYEKEINERLDALHALNYFSLSFPGRDYVAQGFKAAVQRRLDGDISQAYRDALQYKMGIIERDKIGGLKPGAPEAMDERARNLMSDFERILPKQASLQAGDGGQTSNGTTSSGPWLFGLTSPSALDAHLVVFVARMRDVGRANIIPETISDYADRAMALPEWQAVMEGRKTMIEA
ncbi:uncharacterized protein Z520_03577 [Fonsecaea multimorphosa CBS 102226]|uniref:GST N-terminal domain-containing protein n=1 Tax=Fonsecaea multimorphosa CBS 102226 TaxID=1442371 RepID=A0A0D2HGD4_9EURO|nr:uncharacterized protein Z520_03577 [Fonsecaea multimorphosa CBS 102226]KIY00911.1 hypothetical protein Z520_03577 [Fonsecaea multimorphosa CBS 102226]OAL27737.1 hypothetical protein AYO22_03403 [Fonsecaea multimorphosa]